jgi:uncharacterized protein (TIGR02118 family)
MIRVSALYPASEGARFDADYWTDKHMPLVASELGDALTKWEADICLDGGDGAGTPPYVAVAHMFFDSVESFQGAFAEKAGAIMGDLPNYTDINPQLLISEVHTP